MLEAAVELREGRGPYDAADVKVCFLTNDLQLSGGVGVLIHHARQLHDHHGFEVWLVLVREQEDPSWSHEALQGLRVASFDEARAETGGPFDLAISTWWETTYSLFDVPAERYVSFVQSLEDRFYRADEEERLPAALMLDLPVAFLTEATWISETLADLRPDAACHLIRNGVEKDIFTPVEAIDRDDARPLRILVEGYADIWFKGVNAAIDAVAAMAEPHVLTVVAPNRDGLRAEHADRVVGPVTQREMAALYAQTDVVLKLSQVEGMYGPPLEGFHGGATCVTTEVTGHDEYIRHGENALLCDWDDLRGTARQLDLLARDRELLHRLREGALATARAWPDWETQGAEMAVALRAIRDAPPPDPYAHAGRLLADLRAGVHVQRLLLRERRDALGKLKRYERLKRVPGVRQGLALKGSRSGRLLLRVARPATRRVKRKLLGSG